jgi:hypothetical protein
VAAILSMSDRRARLAFVLAILGLPSMGVTVPAAVWLGVGSLRQRRLSSGGEPALGLIALVVAGLGVMVINAVVPRLFEAVGAQRTWMGMGLAVALSVAALVFSGSVLRVHPERWGAVLAARAGLIASTAGGAALFGRTLAVIG